MGDEPTVQDFAEAMTEAFKNLRLGSVPPTKLPKFNGIPKKPGDLTLREWLWQLDVYCRHYRLEGEDKATAILDHLSGEARDEILCCRRDDRKDPNKIISVLKKHFGPPDTVQSFRTLFNSRKQLPNESLDDYSRALIRLYDRMEAACEDQGMKDALDTLKDTSLKDQFCEGACGESVRLELRRLKLAQTGKPFGDMREAVRKLYGRKATHCKTDKAQVGFDVVELDQAAFVDQTDVVADHPVVTKIIKGQEKLEKAVSSLVESQAKSQAQLDKLMKSMPPERKCTYCHKYGHWAKNCFKRPKGEQKGQAAAPKDSENK